MQGSGTYHIFDPPIHTRQWTTIVPPLIALLAIPFVVWLSGGPSNDSPEPEAIIVFALTAFLTLAIGVATANSKFVESITLESDKIILRTVKRQITVPWNSVLAPRLPPQFDSIPLQLSVSTNTRRTRVLLLRVSLSQARHIFNHPSCPRFDIPPKIARVLKKE